ncbi:hypothetical protein Dimus_034443 [Dionaea muscipula]
MGKLISFGRLLLDCLISVCVPAPAGAAGSSCFCINSSEEEEEEEVQHELEKKPLVANGGQILRLKDVVSAGQVQQQQTSLALHLKPKTVVLKVSMHCNGCARKVEKHVSRIEGVTSYKVDLETKMVVVIGDVLPIQVLDTHKELESYGFPIGLLPLNVRSYSLNRTSGEFAVNLSDLCKLILPPDNYLATYSKTITGKIVENRIAELDGIRVRAFFQWWSVTGIRSSGDDLVFEVGMVSAKYPSRNFDESPACEGSKSSS